MSSAPRSPSKPYTVLTQNPVHEVKNMSWKLENALMTLDTAYTVKLPLPPSCPVKIDLLVKFRRLNKECSEVSVGLQRTDKRRNICIQMTYDLNIANLDGDVYAKKKAVIQLNCTTNATPHFVLSAKFTSNAVGGSNNDPDCIRLDTTILQELATKNLFVLNEKQEIFFLLPGNVLFVVGDFFVIGCCTMTRSLSDEVELVGKTSSSTDGREVLIRDLMTALESGVQSDIQITVKEDGDIERTYNLHKFLLAARSGFFRRFLEDNRREGIPDYKMDGVTIAMFEIFVKYLYSAQLDDSQEDISTYLELHTMAQKFEVEPLRRECIGNISRLMKEDEVWDVLDVAVQHGYQELKELALDFITENQNVVESERFSEVVETQKDLAAEILRNIVTKRRRKQ